MKRMPPTHVWYWNMFRGHYYLFILNKVFIFGYISTRHINRNDR